MDIEFFLQSGEIVAPKLLGKIICRNIDGEILKFRISETEAYLIGDTASHANKGKTNRNAPMFKAGAYSYVYLCYGIHNMLNIVCNKADIPEAVLIRGAIDIETNKLYNGPGKLTKALRINRDLNNINLLNSNEIWLEDDGFKPEFKTTKRIGINYADQFDIDRPLRFVLI